VEAATVAGVDLRSSLHPGMPARIATRSVAGVATPLRSGMVADVYSDQFGQRKKLGA
jgi:hypothetical protein